MALISVIAQRGTASRGTRSAIGDGRLTSTTSTSRPSISEVENQLAEVEHGSAGFHLDEEIDITVGPGLALRD
jgi:hypothetical protein